VILLLLFSQEVFSQELLSLDRAIEIGLKNNFSIQISNNNAEMAQNDNYIGNAGMLPSLNLNASGNKATNDIKQSYSTGNDVSKVGVASDNLSYGAALNWTLFDGFKMFVTYDKLGVLEDLGNINAKITIETTVSGIIDAYYDVVRQKQLVKVIKDAIDVYDAKVNLAETRYNIGKSSKLDFLQSKVDLNAQKSLLLKQNQALATAKITLNQLLSRNIELDFYVTDTIIIDYKPTIDELKTTTLRQNNFLKSYEKNVKVAELSLKQYQAQRYPTLGIGLNYNFSKTDNEAGFVLLNQNQGLSIGFTATYNLFNGSILNHQIEDAEIYLENTNLQFKDARIQVEAGLMKAWKTFQTDLDVLKLEEDNLSVAKENLDVAMERYKQGASSSIELKDAQQSYEDSQGRVVQARYDAKVAETELMRLNGELVKGSGIK
jgi:outer membrane protein TolC